MSQMRFSAERGESEEKYTSWIVFLRLRGVPVC